MTHIDMNIIANNSKLRLKPKINLTSPKYSFAIDYDTFPDLYTENTGSIFNGGVNNISEPIYRFDCKYRTATKVVPVFGSI